jgi:regulator of sigma E protease
VTLFHWKGTRFTLNWIPFGGFVRLKGENAQTESQSRAKGSFGAASILARVIILVAGVAMNFVFAMLLFAIGFSVGRWIPTYLTYEDLQQAAVRGDVQMTPSVLIDSVLSDGTAKKAGVPPLSILKSVNGIAVTSPEQVPDLQKKAKKAVYVLLTGKSFSSEMSVTVPVEAGKTGVSLRAFPRDLSAPYRSLSQALYFSFREAGMMTVQTVLGLEKLVLSLLSQAQVPEGVTGIVGIAELTHLSVQEGFMTYLRLVALLSLSLAVLNILPLPALDGGRLFFVLIEGLLRRPLNRRFETTTNLVGFALLICLILIITYHDIIRLL